MRTAYFWGLVILIALIGLVYWPLLGFSWRLITGKQRFTWDG